MKAYVVDTNVPIAANGGSKTHVTNGVNWLASGN